MQLKISIAGIKKEEEKENAISIAFIKKEKFSDNGEGATMEYETWEEDTDKKENEIEKVTARGNSHPGPNVPHDTEILRYRSIKV